MTEEYIKWDSTGKIATPCAGVILNEFGDVLTVRLLFSLIIGGATEDLLLTVTPHLAVMSHEEFSHPWMDDQIVLPCLEEGPWSRYNFPILLVRSSKWLASFSETRLVPHDRADVRHFMIVTLDRTIDFLTTKDIQAVWVPPQPI
jgi:hypothetical protein